VELVIQKSVQESGKAGMRGRDKRSGYLPSLDGWRAIAILSVICYHDRVHQFWLFSTSLIHQYGDLGVDLFFAISGVLICSRLLEEERVKGGISLKGFYIRRFFRICPPAWLYLIAYVLLSLFHLLPVDVGGVLASFLMVRNFWVGVAGDTPRTWYTIHFWSLSVEEHFYLLLPSLLIFVKRRRTVLLGVLSVAVMLWVTLVTHFTALQKTGIVLRTDMRIHALLIPAMFAVLLTRQEVRAFVTRWLHPWVAVLLFLAVFTLLTRTHVHLLSLATMFVIPVGFPLLVISTMLHPKSIACRVLEWWPLRFVGHISYSLYLWQQMFFAGGRAPAAWPLSVLQIFPLNYLAAFACATASYYLIEKPLIRVGHRVAHPATPGREDLNEIPAPVSVPTRAVADSALAVSRAESQS
jgi:peptidoglycan/LPS O-acetylase OafA/YrhL